MANGHNALPPELVEKWFENQAKESELREQEIRIRHNEIELQKQQDSNQYEFACKSLDANVEDRKETKEFFSKNFGRFLWFIGVTLTIVVIFSAWALNMGKDALVEDIIKMFFTFAGGLGAGFGVGQWWGKKTADQD
jgi:hypothetical protein